jgi:uncharacterized protein (TIGR00730 family)
MDLFKRSNETNKKVSNGAGICRIPLTLAERAACTSPLQAPQMSEITWRIFRIMAEFVEGFQFLSTTSKTVTVFGSARLPPTNCWYQEAVKFGRLLGQHGFTVITGGGPGIMEAANKGVYEVGGESLGLNIELQHEQRINPYVNHSRSFHYFFTRKVMLAASAQAYVYFPGGFGTLDELFEIVTLITTKKSEPISVVLVSHDFWDPLLVWLKQTMVDTYDTLGDEELNIFKVVDTAEEAFEIVKMSQERSFF